MIRTDPKPSIEHVRRAGHLPESEGDPREWDQHGQASGHSKEPRGAILLDLSDAPIREMLLVAVLPEMIRAATASVQNTSLK